MTDKQLAQVLAWTNKQRAKLGMKPLKKMPTKWEGSYKVGKPALRCPLEKALGLIGGKATREESKSGYVHLQPAKYLGRVGFGSIIFTEAGRKTGEKLGAEQGQFELYLPLPKFMQNFVRWVDEERDNV